MISVPCGKDDLSLYRSIPSSLALAPWGFGQLLPAVSFSSCEFCNEQRNVLSVSLHPFIFRKRQWSTRYTQFAMILAGVLLGQIPCLYAPFGTNTAKGKHLLIQVLFHLSKLKAAKINFYSKGCPLLSHSGHVYNRGVRCRLTIPLVYTNINNRKQRYRRLLPLFSISWR